jgi:hypothetical protein
MATRRSRRKTNFLDRYNLDDRFLQRPDPKIGRAGMIGGTDLETGQRVVIKEWRRDPNLLDEELREIWRQEIRQLHRLAGYPGAREHIVMLHDSAESADGFYLVLSPGQRLPLQTLLHSARDQHWLKQLRPHRNRLRLWKDLRRIAVGLDILHRQGLLHRNLDTWAIFTAGGDEPDFQLSGFEWSIRLTGVADRLRRPGDHSVSDEPLVYSFLQDWQAFGALAASLLGVDAKVLIGNGRRADTRGPAEHLIGVERDLLLSLLRADPLKRLDGEVVCQRIDAILSGLSVVVGRLDVRLYLTCDLGPDSRLSQAIRTGSNRVVDVGEVAQQLDFIRADLAEEPLLLAMSDENAVSGRRYVLVGRSLTYRLSAFRPRNRSESTWDVAHCDSVAAQRPAPAAILGQCSLLGIPIALLPRQEADSRLATLQGKAARWDRQIAGSPADEGNDDALRQHRALVLVQLIEALLIAAEIWPVMVTDQRKVEGGLAISIKPRPDEERERLSQALGLRSPAARMREAFATDQTAVDDDWKLTEVGVLGERDHETARWRFVGIEAEDGSEPIYVFEGSGAPPIGDALFLRVSDYVGQDRLLRRRVKALRALRDHTELLATLADPRIAVRKTHDTLIEDEAFRALDVSKREALKELWAVIPVYFVQGPPAVGKTRLVRELVARRFRDDRTTRLLLTAQSHHSLDHLLDEVRKVLHQLEGEAPLNIRCRPKDYDASPGPFDLREQARATVDRLMASQLAATAPAEIRSKLDTLKASFRRPSDDEDDTLLSPTSHPDRAFEALLLRSANVVFASTNAGDLERLIEERAQFDWTIIEEAGRATGVELVSPMLLSHRRLMIGDHEQLPPFGADQIKRLLTDPGKISDALDCGRPIVSRPFREAGMGDMVDGIGADEALTTVCGEAAAALMMFETMVEAELGASRELSPRLPIAKQLLHQHRMHPAIARLVSATFYCGSLLTDEDCKRRYSEQSPPFAITAPGRLPISPIVFIDTPFVQSTIDRQMVERQPRYHNPEEVDAIVTVLSLLRSEPTVGEKPTLAVLTPYREQARRLRDRINDERGALLAHISAFGVEGEAGNPVATVDSFQGSEADVVLISLVRNNHHTGRRALGFLSDPRRMNVLLSRAKWKLVLVGSLEFLEKRFQTGRRYRRPSRWRSCAGCWTRSRRCGARQTRGGAHSQPRCLSRP